MRRPPCVGLSKRLQSCKIRVPWRGTEAVTTAPTRNRLGAKRPTWVRIPPSPPIQKAPHGAFSVSAFTREEILQQSTALLGQDTALHLQPVVELIAAGQVEDGTGGTGLWVSSAVHQARHPRMHQGTRAHGAGLEGDIESSAREPVVARGLGRGA